MNSIIKILFGCIALAAMQGAPEAQAQPARLATVPATPEAGTALSPQVRGALARRFVLRWGHHVERVYGVKAGTWAARMVPTFANADPANLRNALARETFEGAVSELNGRGQRVSDDRVLIALNQAALTGRADAIEKVLGSATGDMVFTPVQPCRLVDTRIAGGAIPAGAMRDFRAISSNFAGQGGSGTDCGTGGNALIGAVVLNVVAITPNLAGFATVFPFGSPQPDVSSINYTAGAIVSNTVFTRTPNPMAAYEFTIYTYAQSHFVVDVVGYFSAPQATALQCTLSAAGTVNIPVNSSAIVFSPACPAGYSRVSNSCDTTSNQAYLSVSSIAGCQARNASGSVQQLTAQSYCCRVPGR